MNEDYSRSPDRVVASEKVVSGRKIFFLDYKENNRGRVLKITEDVNGRRDTIMVPDEALDDFADALERILNTDDAGPPADNG
jgi:PurA ssDNA and RNA-binding protein